jgi:putative colanic acid biosynthesis acetyltransferase WcaF
MNPQHVTPRISGISRVPSKSPYSFREKVRMGSWWAIEASFFRNSLHKMNGLRCLLLRLYGAKVGSNTFIHPKAKIWFPWNLEIGSNAGIGFDALIYNLAYVHIGDYATISHRVHVNTASHDYTDPGFRLVTRPIHIGEGAFVGTDSYIGLGVAIGKMAVIGARSVVVSDQPDFTVCFGHPCKPHKEFNSLAEVGL